MKIITIFPIRFPIFFKYKGIKIFSKESGYYCLFVYVEMMKRRKLAYKNKTYMHEKSELFLSPDFK